MRIDMKFYFEVFFSSFFAFFVFFWSGILAFFASCTADQLIRNHIEIQMELLNVLGIHDVVLLDGLNFTSSYMNRNGLHDFLLSSFLTIIYRQYILKQVLWRLSYYLLNKINQISLMDCRNNIISLSKIGQKLGFLKPGMLELIVEDFFSFSIQNTGAYDVDFEIFSLAGESQVFQFLVDLVVVGWHTDFIVFLSEGLFKPFDFWFRGFLLIRYHI